MLAGLHKITISKKIKTLGVVSQKHKYFEKKDFEKMAAMRNPYNVFFRLNRFPLKITVLLLLEQELAITQHINLLLLLLSQLSSV